MIVSSVKRSHFGLLAAMLVCLLATGCLKNKLLIKVNKDGTGKIFVTRVWSQQVAAMYGMQVAAWDDEEEDEEAVDPFYNEAALKAAAGEFGPGVTFVKARKYDNAGSRGYIALYKFEDINEIFVNMESLAGEDMMDLDMYDMIEDDEEIEVADKEDNAFEFSLTKGDQAKLTIIIPDYPDVEPIDDKKLDEEDEDEDEMSPGQLRREMYSMMSGSGFDSRAAMMMMSGYTGNESQYDMMARAARGTRISFEIEIEGADVKIQASHQNKTKKNRFTLVNLDLDKAITDKKKVKRLMKTMEDGDYDSPLEGLFALRKTPGMLLETNKNVTVTFK